MSKINMIKIDDYRWEIPQQGAMRVSGRIFANQRLAKLLEKDDSLQQVMNVATLPGIVGHSLAMPDIHQGYGFPIGGVATMDIQTGVISPGGVGYDINCGVRFIKTNLFYENIKGSLKSLLSELYHRVPTGVGSKGAIRKLSLRDLDQIMVQGAKWPVNEGYGSTTDLEFTEENGFMRGANPDCVSHKAKNRGLDQLGTLGSGNHFIEIGVVADIYAEEEALFLGLAPGQIIVMIHSGSRGLGHQVCDDYIREMKRQHNPKDFTLPDNNLISAYFDSPVAKKYYSAMICAANFAWANRQVMMSFVKEAFLSNLNISEGDLGFSLIYDVCHNIAKVETHTVGNGKKNLCVHRKGATRAFPPGHPAVSPRYQKTGQPVIVPGDMGRQSYLCLGTEKAMKETFGSSCHGAGRVMSRKEALRSSTPDRVLTEMGNSNIYVHAATKATLVEEMSNAYKDVTDVVDTMTNCGLLKKVVKTKPIGVIKG
jgi:tRNA-splicing ligase RtcB (3'-phosphate/5'-hydroxy nucleic acid ligase)